MRYYKIRIILVAIVTMMGIGFTEVSAFQSESQPTVGIDSTGNLVAIWSVYDDQNGTYVIRSSSWNSISGWSPNTTISTTPGII